VGAGSALRLRLGTGVNGEALFPTAEEAERAAKEVKRAAKEVKRAAKEVKRAAKEVKRAAKEAALARGAELEAPCAVGDSDYFDEPPQRAAHGRAGLAHAICCEATPAAFFSGD
jgi:hypothetical protein